MSARARRIAVTVASLGLVALGALGVACVDLFHSTDFDTLCVKSPSDPACVADDGGDGAADVVVGKPDGPNTDAAPMHPDFCAWSTQEARKQALRACAWLGACERPIGESLFGACVVHAQLAYDCGLNPSLRPIGAIDALWSCLTTVKSCGDVDTCVFPAGLQECNAVPTGTSTACGTGANGTVRLECSGDAGRAHGVEPCALTGRSCTYEDTSVAKCAGVEGFACSTAKGICVDASTVDCRTAGTRSVDQGVDCRGYGAGACTLSDAGPACVPTKTASTCVGNTPPLCDGAIVRTCVGDQDVRIDCARLDLPCDVTQATTADPTAGCIKRGVGECTDTDVCPTPGTLRSCGRGVAYEVDCASAGLGNCIIDTAGRGACSPP